MSCRRSTEIAAPILVVQTGHALATLRPRHGDFPDWFRHGLRLAPEQIASVCVADGAPLPTAANYAGIIVTGSGAMVTDHLAWSEDTAAWLRDAVAAQVPVLGVCYGHQLLAYALGGQVGDHPRGREVGTIELERLPAADGDPLFDAAPARFRAHATHQQAVLELPDGALRLAASAHDPNQALRFGACAWGLQFHPEFSVEIMRAYLRRPDPHNCGEACCRDRRAAPAPFARDLLHRFRAVCLARTA